MVTQLAIPTIGGWLFAAGPFDYVELQQRLIASDAAWRSPHVRSIGTQNRDLSGIEFTFVPDGHA